jgi:O-antigen/teichoic acid export membrane protein
MTYRVEISKRLVLVNTASAVLTKAINVIIVVWLTKYLLDRVSREEYGLMSLLISIIIVLPLITSILTAGVGRYVLEAYAQEDDRRVTQIVSTMLPLLLAAGGVILTVGWIFAWYIDQFLVILPGRLWDARIMMALLVFSAAIKPPCMAFSVAFYVRQKLVLSNVINLCGELLRAFLLVVLLLGVGTRVLWVVVANVSAELAVTVGSMVLSMRLIPALRFRAREIRWAQARELVSFGGWSLVGYLAYRLREMTVMVVLNRFAAAEVAVLSLGYLGRRQIDTWTDVLGGSLYPVVTSMHAVGAQDRIRSVYMRGGRIVLWITLLIGLPAALYAEAIIRRYVGEGFLGAGAIMILSLVGLPITGGAWMIWQVSNATGRLRGPSSYVLVSQMAIIASVYYAVRILGWGALGAALATIAVGVLPDFLVLWPLGLRLSGATFDGWVRETLIPGLTPGILASVVWSGLGVLVQPASWTALGLCTLAGMVCYLIVLLAVCLEPRDREDLGKTIVKIKNMARTCFGAPGPAPASVVARLSSDALAAPAKSRQDGSG